MDFLGNNLTLGRTLFFFTAARATPGSLRPGLSLSPDKQRADANATRAT